MVQRLRQPTRQNFRELQFYRLKGAANTNADLTAATMEVVNLISSSASRAASSVGVTTLVNVTERGVLTHVVVRASAVSGGSAAMRLNINIDGTGVQVLQFFLAGGETQLAADYRVSDVANHMGVYYGVSYATSLLVELDVHTAGTGGTYFCSLYRGQR